MRDSEPSQQCKTALVLFSSLWVTHPVGMRFDFIMIMPLLLSCCSLVFVFGHGVPFFLVGSSILLSMDVQQLVVERICFYLEQCLFLSVGHFYNNTWRSKTYTHFLGDRIPTLYFSRLFSVLAFNHEKSFR